MVQGDDRYERALQLLDKCQHHFSVSDAFALLHAVRQEGKWATRVSFVYSAKEQTVYYAENNRLDHMAKFVFPPAKQGTSRYGSENLSSFKGARNGFA